MLALVAVSSVFGACGGGSENKDTRPDLGVPTSDSRLSSPDGLLPDLGQPGKDAAADVKPQGADASVPDGLTPTADTKIADTQIASPEVGTDSPPAQPDAPVLRLDAQLPDTKGPADTRVPDDGRGLADAGSNPGPDVGPLASCLMLDYTTNAEPAVTPPLTIVYPAFGNASIAGKGSNSAHVGYTLSLAYVNGGAGVSFGTYDSDTAEGVPWDDAAGLLTDGTVKAWAIDSTNGASTHSITLTFDTPVTGFKFAITDLDTAGEELSIRAYSVPTGGTAIGLTNHLLANPISLPELARGVAHTGNDAYVIDQTRVSATDGVYRVSTTSATSSQNGTVLFVFGDAQPIQRVEITLTGNSSGAWIAGMTYANLCGS
jgi:hypothetical protein